LDKICAVMGLACVSAKAISSSSMNLNKKETIVGSQPRQVMT
jgi:hypothetical protein